MSTTRNRWVAAATASWMGCLIVASLAVAADENAQFQVPDVGGLWHVEGDRTRESGHRVLYAYDELRDEDYDEAMAIHFGDGQPPASVVQRGRKVEGTATRNVPCGEYPQVMFAGTVSEDNRVELTVTIPGIEEWCYQDQTLHFVQTDWVGSFEGIYDPTEKVITGTFTANQERDYLEGWQPDGSYWFEDKTNVIDSGTFRIKVVKPWILIHGWDAGPDKWNAFADFLERDQIPYATVDLRPDADPYVRARILAREIDRIRVEKEWKDIRLDLVAHSQGGLDARAYLRGLGDGAKDQIHSLTMIATPNHGTIGADWRNFFYTLALRPGKCTAWLTPGWVEAFNKNEFNKHGSFVVDGVKYYTAAGLLQYSPFSLKKDRFGSLAIPGGDDGVVPVKSVALDGAESLGVFLYDHNGLVTQEKAYNAVKSKIDPAYPDEPNSLAFTAIEDGELPAGQPVSRSVAVDDVNKVALVLISAGPVDFSLQSPGGERITPQSLDPNVSHDSGDWLDLQAQAYVVERPAPGVWRAEVTGGAEPDHFVLLVSAESTFVLDANTDEYFNPVGEKVTIRAALDAYATITDMGGAIIGPDGYRDLIVLYDDGLHDDALPDDGLYGNAFTPSLEGEYTLIFSTKGVVGKTPFSRADLKSISVVGPASPSQ